ncbi:MAG TPA: DUF4412 domain-containing protein [Saprospiraceae bacterium]|nr:DUF4412 domain-containing protein [Saprospiraceae bacterium]
MKKLLYLVLATVFLGLSAPHSQAQIVKDILRKAGNRLENKAEDMVAEAIAEAVARQLQKKIDNYFEDLARETYRQDSIRAAENGETLEYKDYQGMMEQMMAGMNDQSKILDEYHFNLILDVEISSGKETDESRFFYNNEQAYFAVEQEEDGDIHRMVFDLENDVIVLFNESKKGEKTAQALPWMLSNSAVIAASSEEMRQPVNIRKTGESKTIAGYTCEQYRGEDEEYTYEFYASPKLGDYWEESMGQFMQRFTNYEYNEELQKIDGLLMESITTKKEEEKKKPKFSFGKNNEDKPNPNSDTWRVIRVDKSGYQLKKADYEFAAYGTKE